MYYKKLKGLWDEIDALEAPYMCTCSCVCANGRLNGARETRNRLLQFLMGLDECFSNVRGQILLMQPMPNATKAYSMQRQEEKQREAVTPKYHTIPNNRKARTTFTPNTRRSTFKPGVICGNYQKEGHYQNEFCQLVGYPVGHPLHGKFKPGTSGQNRTSNFKQRTINLVTGQAGQDTSEAQVEHSLMKQSLLRWTHYKTNLIKS